MTFGCPPFGRRSKSAGTMRTKRLRFFRPPYPTSKARPNAGAAAGATLYPIYVRGEAYLRLRQGKEAAAEFQKILDKRTIVQNFITGALAHLGLARAYALEAASAQGAEADAARAKARAAYNDFFTLWKDADPDIPILKEAKAEYAKLQ